MKIGSTPNTTYQIPCKSLTTSVMTHFFFLFFYFSIAATLRVESARWMWPSWFKQKIIRDKLKISELLCAHQQAFRAYGRWVRTVGGKNIQMYGGRTISLSLAVFSSSSLLLQCLVCSWTAVGRIFCLVFWRSRHFCSMWEDDWRRGKLKGEPVKLQKKIKNRKAEFLAESEACEAMFWPTASLTAATFDSHGFSAGRAFNPFTSMMPLENDQQKSKIWNP